MENLEFRLIQEETFEIGYFNLNGCHHKVFIQLSLQHLSLELYYNIRLMFFIYNVNSKNCEFG